jgi:uncharacterized lipoprotein YmbA
MARAFILLIWIGSSALATLGCGTSPPSRFYTLDSTATPAVGSPLGDGIVVGPVSIPESVDRPNFVVEVGPNQVAIDEFNRWAAPLADAIARVVAADLAVLLQAPHVATAPFASFDPVYRVTIDVQRFDSIPGEAAAFEAVWVVRETTGSAIRSGRTVAREPVDGTDFGTLAAAHSRALRTLSTDIAAGIQAVAKAR